MLRFHRPIGRFFRRRRMRTFGQTFRLKAASRVLDVGGYPYYWRWLDEPPRVTIVNLEAPVEGRQNCDWVIADARQLPFRDDVFSVVFANSVIEHIRGEPNRRQFAAEVERVGQRYYVQTPNRWFPVEPHLMTPFIHYLPRGLQRRLVRNFTVWGLVTRSTPEEGAGFLALTELLAKQDLRKLFPNADIWAERFLGLAKSWIAVSPPAGASRRGEV
jgi:hypothetical protein